MDRLPVVHKQLLCLNVDPKGEVLSGWTEIQFSCARGETSIGLHAYKLNISAITVDKHPAAFELKPYPLVGLPASIFKATYSSSKDAAGKVAEVSRHEYERVLQREEEPELLIRLPSQVQPRTMDPMLDATLRIDYEVSNSGSGIYFNGDYAFTDNEIRRARAWFPCVDTPASAHPFDVRLTVADGLTAVGPGSLQKVTLTLDRRKTFHYQLPLDTPPCHISIAVEAVVTHFSCGSDQAALECTAQYLPLAFGLFESLLSACFPYRALQQVFMPAGFGAGHPIAAAALQLLPAQLLFKDRCVEQARLPFTVNTLHCHAIEARQAIVRELARQWFGIFLRPKAPADAWLLQGLAGWLEDQFVKLYMGRNEQAFRRYKEREAIYLLDDGQAPPLYPRGESYPWGTMHGTEALDPSELRRWKSAAVIGMLEKRVGEEPFKRLLERMVTAACEDSGRDVTKRLLGTRDFLKEVGRQGGFRKDITAFHERWIAGQGCPHITAAFTFHKKRNILEVALRQSGNDAARKSLERAAAAAAASKDGSGIGIVEVQVRQDKSNPASTTETPVNIGLGPLTLVDLKLSTKQQMKRLKRKRKGAAAADEDSADEEPAGEEPESLSNVPISWVRVDPNAELLASIQVLQPPGMWSAQLDFSRDVAAQSAAVAGLAAERPFSYKALNALQGCLENPKVYCRVRMEAAMAIGATAHLLEDRPAMDKLIRFYTERCFDRDTHRPKQHHFDNLAEQFVNQAVISALALIRDAVRLTPPEVSDLLLEVLEHNDNSTNPFSDDGFLRIVFRACGLLRLPSQQVLDALLEQAERHLARDEVMPSQHRLVSTSILESLANLAIHHTAVSSRVSKVLRDYTAADSPFALQTAATLSLHRMAAAHKPLEEALVADNTALHPALRESLLEDSWRLALQLPREALLPAEPAAAATALQRLHNVLGAGHDSPRRRHLAFMLLQRAAGLSPSLFKEPVEELLPTGPSMSMETAVRGGRTVARPAPSAAGSLGSGGRAASGIKVTLRGATSMAPAVSQGARPSRSNLTTPQKSEERPPSPTSGLPAPAASQPVELHSEVKPEPVHIFGGFPQAAVPPSAPLSPRLAAAAAAVPAQREAVKTKRSNKRRKVEADGAPQAAVLPNPAVQTLKPPASAPASPAPEEKQLVLQDVLAIMTAPSQAKQPKAKTKRASGGNPRSSPAPPAQPPPPDAAPKPAPGTWRPRGAGGWASAPAATAATATQAPPAATANVAPTAADVKPPLPEAAAAKQEGKGRKKPSLSIKLSLGGKKTAAAASGTDVSEAAQQPVASFGKQASLSPVPAAATASQPPAATKKSLEPKAKKQRKASVNGRPPASAPAAAPAQKPQQGESPQSGVSKAAASTKAKLTIKPPRPVSQAISQPQPKPAKQTSASTATAAATQSSGGAPRLKIKVGGRAMGGGAGPTTAAPSASGSLAPKSSGNAPATASLRPSASPAPAAAQAPGAATSSVAAGLAQPANETPEQRAERKRLEKLAKQERRQDETEAEKAARRAAKKDKKDVKRARKDSQEPSQMPPG